MWLDFSNPTILSLDNKTFNPEYVVIPENYPNTSWVYLLIDAAPLTTDDRRRSDVPAAHPVSQPRG